MRKSIPAAAALLLLLSGCASLHQPNALKVNVDGVVTVVRYNHAGLYKVGDTVQVPIWFQTPYHKGDYFAEEGTVVKVLHLHTDVIDDELTGEEVEMLLDNILN